MMALRLPIPDAQHHTNIFPHYIDRLCPLHGIVGERRKQKLVIGGGLHF
jgi:hypothetical protein